MEISTALQNASAKARRLAWISRANLAPNLGIILVLLVNVLAGLIVVTDYGESWDEHLRYRYAERSLSAYVSQGRAPRDEKGPFYVMTARLGAEALQRAAGNWRFIEAWHFMHFLAFLMSLFFLYRLCLRFVRPPAALGAVLLFNTQPLLWGHAFINPKDIPFMAFFLASVTLGLEMADRFSWQETARNKSSGETVSMAPVTWLSEWRNLDARLRQFWTLLAVLTLGLLAFLVLGNGVINDWITILVRRAYATGLLSRLAGGLSGAPVENYVQKSLRLYPRLVLFIAAAAAAGHLILAARFFPLSSRRAWQEQGRPFVRAVLSQIGRRSVLLAGILWGLCASIRTLGPVAGVIASLYFLSKHGRRSGPPLVAYLLIAVTVTYLTWPGLWRSPIQSYLGSFGQASDFPWEGKVLFQGIDHPVDELPRSYLPTLFSLQFTEPAMLLFLWGLMASALGWGSGISRRLLLVLLGGWLFVPIAGAVILRPTLYDNFRQFLFVVPPIFVWVGIGLQNLLDRLKNRTLFALVVAAFLIPNLLALVRLHPYQYVYYNLLAGGVQGAFRQYELDYWAISYKEATEYLNAVAPPGAAVIVWGPEHLVRSYIRPDLSVLDYRKAQDQGLNGDYAVISTRHMKDQSLYPEAETLYSISRDGGVLAVIKALDRAHSSSP